MARKETMSSRERWLAVLNRGIPDRLPMTYRATEEFTQKLLKLTRCADLAEFCARYHLDGLTHAHPRYAGPRVPADGDIFGCRYTTIRYATGSYRECCHHPLAEYDTVQEIDARMDWPTADWYDYSGIRDFAARNAHLPLAGPGWEPFLVYKNLRGEERSYMDLIEYPEIVHHIMGKLFDLHYEISRRTLEECGGRVILCGGGEDLGSQSSLLYSPEHIRAFFLPYHKRMFDMQHSYGAKCMWHTDGAARDILPDLIGIGVDVLDPVQWRCDGMAREGLKADFGDKLLFHGGVDNQYTLPFGSQEDVRDEVRENFRILGANGGYILGPCHNFQPVGPAENAVAMYETCYEECWY